MIPLQSTLEKVPLNTITRKMHTKVVTKTKIRELSGLMMELTIIAIPAKLSLHKDSLKSLPIREINSLIRTP